MTFIIGTGRTRAFTPPRYLNSGWRMAWAAAFAVANDTAKIAFAPSFFLFWVESKRIIARSIAHWSKASIPISAEAIFMFTFATAFNTPLPL